MGRTDRQARLHAFRHGLDDDERANLDQQQGPVESRHPELAEEGGCLDQLDEDEEIAE